MAWQIASLASLTLSYVAAMQFGPALAPHIAAEAPWNKFGGMLVVYLGTSLAIWIAFRAVAAFIDRVKLEEFDRQVGALFGAAKGVLFCLCITFFAVSLSTYAREEIMKTKSGHAAAWLMDKAEPIIPEELHVMLEPYIHELDDALPADQRNPHRHAGRDPSAWPTTGGQTPAPGTGWFDPSTGEWDEGEPGQAGQRALDRLQGEVQDGLKKLDGFRDAAGRYWPGEPPRR
jgi:membrane protein required for colicin V production